MEAVTRDRTSFDQFTVNMDSSDSFPILAKVDFVSRS